jgi:hypothetical protein
MLYSGKKREGNMPTQEERLAAVEFGLAQFKTESIQAHQEVAMELTMVKGLTHDSIRRLTELRIETNQRFNVVHQEMAEMRLETNQRFNVVHQEMAEMRQEMNQRFSTVDQEIAGMKQDIGSMQQDIGGLHGKFDRLEKLILERLPSP